MNFPDNPCWDFALVVYRRDGVAEACLALQESQGVDVNVLLFCCWLGESGRGGLSA
ncbi:MAG: TIGR02444 family protein, partial [Alphaproteobacteria bacterium]